jgi:hypothetical protein
VIAKGIITALVLLAGAGMAMGQTTSFKVMRDEFGTGDAHQLRMETRDAAVGILFVTCYTPSEIQIQLAVKDVIFPSDADVMAGNMWIGITHKVDTAAVPATVRWRMNVAKYKDAWMPAKSVRSLIADMLKGQQLSLRLDKSGTIYRFNLVEARGHLPKIEAACAVRAKPPAQKK